MITLEMMPPMMFGGLGSGDVDRLSGRLHTGCGGAFIRIPSIHLGFFDLNFLQAIPGRVFGSVLSNELLLAIPFFTFMGSLLERCGLAEDMLDWPAVWTNPRRTKIPTSVPMPPAIAPMIRNFRPVLLKSLW